MTHPSLASAAASFRHFFTELREAFLEREGLFTQIELALLSKEHVLIVGPPGTAKSAVASGVLGRILDARSGAPSLFSKQLSESTMQSDLIGPVDFKVLTETGRTEYLTDDGMLGATHAFLDEVFDGRDMLLRSILNVLHERELKHGRKVTAGKIECAIMTSNRYLSEVVARSPELLWAFADRLSFVSFVPKSFARPQSRAAMLMRANKGQRTELKAPLTLQELDVLQAAVERTQVSAEVIEQLEALTEDLERTLTQQATRLPDYVPTKSFSQRSVVKALWALKAAVVRDAVWHRPHRRLLATTDDLESLRSFFVLGGPSAEDVEALLKVSVDPRERSQLEAIRFEQRAFDEALARVREKGAQGVSREAELLGAKQELQQAEALSKSFNVAAFSGLMDQLRHKLIPGPRHPQNREPLISAARLALSSLSQQLSDGHVLEADLGNGQVLARGVIQALALAELVAELRPRVPALATAAAHFVERSMSLGALSAEGRAFETQSNHAAVLNLVRASAEQLGAFSELAAQVSSTRPDAAGSLDAAESDARGRVLRSLHAQAVEALRIPPQGLDSALQFLAQSRQLHELDAALQQIGSYGQELQPVRDLLLVPLARTFLTDAVRASQSASVESFARELESHCEAILREGLPVADSVAAVATTINEKLQAIARARRAVSAVELSSDEALEGRAYSRYQDLFGEEPLGGEIAALDVIDAQAGSHAPIVDGPTRSLVAAVEARASRQRAEFIRTWFVHLSNAAPPAERTSRAEEIEQLVSAVVKSRLPVLLLREGELMRIAAALTQVETRGDASAGALRQSVQRLHEEIAAWCQKVLALRSANLPRRVRAA